MLQLLGMLDDDRYPWEEVEPSPRRGQAWLWIGLPLLVGLLLLGGLIGLVITRGFGGLSVWADASLIFVLLPACLMGIIPLLLLVGLSYAVAQLTGWLPGPMAEAERLMRRVAYESRRGADVAARPMLVFQGILATIETFLRGLVDLLGLKGGRNG
jgi:uncharacterized protein involved in cysteine biosynthesis